MGRSQTIETFRLFLFFCLCISRSSATPIVNGNFKPTEPSTGEYPFHANLLQLIGRNRYFSFCGGSLIHPKWVLTAAHCIQEDKHTRAFKASEIYVALGSVYRSGKNGQLHGVKKTYIHPTYLKTDKNDIGLLRLKKSAKLGSSVKLIRLHVNDKESLVKKTAYLTGFGVINDRRQTPQRMRKAKFHISSYKKCTGYRRYRHSEICATSTLAEGKACDGDSGGPLFVVKNKKRVQIGITSYLARSAKCELVNNNSVYTRVSAYISWISKVTGVNFRTYNQQ